jgi:hypothetical protein
MFRSRRPCQASLIFDDGTRNSRQACTAVHQTILQIYLTILRTTGCLKASRVSIGGRWQVAYDVSLVFSPFLQIRPAELRSSTKLVNVLTWSSTGSSLRVFSSPGRRSFQQLCPPTRTGSRLYPDNNLQVVAPSKESCDTVRASTTTFHHLSTRSRSSCELTLKSIPEITLLSIAYLWDSFMPLRSQTIHKTRGGCGRTPVCQETRVDRILDID